MSKYADLTAKYRSELEQAQGRLQQARGLASQLEQAIISLASRISLLDELEKGEQPKKPAKGG